MGVLSLLVQRPQDLHRQAPLAAFESEAGVDQLISLYKGGLAGKSAR